MAPPARRKVDFLTEPSAAPTRSGEPERPSDELAQKLGYNFADHQLLRDALVHKSYLHDRKSRNLRSNERLEFLGDAVLGLIVSEDLYRTNPVKSEGDLSALRGALVRLTTLAEIAESINLGEYLYMSYGEAAAGGRKRAGNMGHALEAVLGAVYLDGGLDAAADVWRTIAGERNIEQLLDVLRSDFKSQLQHEAQATFHHTPSYELTSTSGPDHAKTFRVEVRVGDKVLGAGSGPNKQAAQQEAAKVALATIRARESASSAGYAREEDQE